jgi:hypothetical protein
MDAASMSRSLEELDGERWEEPPDATQLIRDCLRPRKVALTELSGEDVTMLLGQRIGAPWLVPLALNRLESDPLAGDWYPGELLNAVLQTRSDYWDDHPAEIVRLWNVREELESRRVEAAKLLADERWPSFG